MSGKVLPKHFRGKKNSTGHCTFFSMFRGLFSLSSQLQCVIGYFFTSKVWRHYKDGVFADDSFSFSVCQTALKLKTVFNKYYHSKYLFLPLHWSRAHHVTCKLLRTNKCFAPNDILLIRNWNYALVWKWPIGSPSRQRVIWHIRSIKRTVIEWKTNYSTLLLQNIVSCQCLADQLFASAFGFGK